MTETIVLRPILPKNQRFMIDADTALIASVTATMKGPIAKLLKNAEESVIKDWKHKPDIAAEFEQQKTQLKLLVKPKGVHKRYWVFVSFGVDPHPIQSKSGSPMFIKGGYSAKTRPGGGGGTGSYSGPFYWWPKTVDNWPGIKPRYFEKGIKKDNAKKVVALMGAAWKQTVYRMGG